MNVLTDSCLLEARRLVFNTLILACDHWVWEPGEHGHRVHNLLDIARWATSCWLRASFSTNVLWVLGCQHSVGLVKELWPVYQLGQLQILFLFVLFFFFYPNTSPFTSGMYFNYRTFLVVAVNMYLNICLFSIWVHCYLILLKSKIEKLNYFS